MSRPGELPRAPPALFDRIAPVYDRTRGPLDPITSDALGRALSDRGVRSVLEVGVGTGRVAAPLIDRGLQLTGVDASLSMARQARAKGVDRVALGTAYRLPFRSGAFDAVLFAHVLHLLDQPFRALQESGRTARHGIFALVNLRDGRADHDGGSGEDDLRSQLHALLRERGIDMAPFRPPWRRERELLERYPPAERVPLSDRTTTEPAGQLIDALALRGYRNLLDVPPEAMASAIAELRTRSQDRSITSRRVYALVHWAKAPEAPRD